MLIDLYKKNKVILSCLVIFLLMTNSYGQKIKIDKKFFTTYNTRISIALGVDASPNLSSSNDDFSLIMPVNNDNKQNFIFEKTANWNLNLGFDIYSPNSLIGFFVSAEYNLQRYAIINSSISLVDFIENSNIELPAYIKFRFGKATGKSYAWLALGGGYSIPFKTKIDFANNNMSNVNIFKPIAFLSGLIGYEINIQSVNNYYASNLRLLFYVKGNYDLENRIDTNVLVPQNSVLNELSSLEVQFLRISFGMKILIF